MFLNKPFTISQLRAAVNGLLAAAMPAAQGKPLT
jgi:hypothetical protein